MKCDWEPIKVVEKKEDAPPADTDGLAAMIAMVEFDIHCSNVKYLVSEAVKRSSRRLPTETVDRIRSEFGQAKQFLNMALMCLEED